VSGTGGGTWTPDALEVLEVTAPGRVNLIGDHTDYMGGLVMPMAIDLHTTLRGVRVGTVIDLRSDAEPQVAHIELPCTDPADQEPPWARYVAAVAVELGATVGLRGEVTSTIPEGSGLSSSAALEVAVAVALGAASTDPVELARRCQRAEHSATGVPCGIMDQLVVAAGVAGHALMIDCDTLAFDPVPLPSDAAVWVVHSGRSRSLAGSAYAQRRDAAEAAAELVGPLPAASIDDIEALDDPVLRRRARHVRTECDRVLAFRRALRAGDLVTAGATMLASHESLRDDFEVSTDGLDALVARLVGSPGVYGARLTGAGFGGCVVALAEPGTDLSGAGDRVWRVEAADGVHRRSGRAGGDDRRSQPG
jgi:galactokinase